MRLPTDGIWPRRPGQSTDLDAALSAQLLGIAQAALPIPSVDPMVKRRSGYGSTFRIPPALLASWPASSAATPNCLEVLITPSIAHP